MSKTLPVFSIIILLIGLIYVVIAIISSENKNKKIKITDTDPIIWFQKEQAKRDSQQHDFYKIFIVYLFSTTISILLIVLSLFS